MPKHDIEAAGKDEGETESVTSHSSDCNSLSDQTISSGRSMPDDDDLSQCEQGDAKKVDGTRENSSIDTESLTNDPSLLSSFSSDGQDHSPSPSRLNNNTDQQECDQDELYAPDGFGSLSDRYSVPQLRHRRENDNRSRGNYYTQPSASAADNNDVGNNYYLSDLDENGLSPSAKHKPTTLSSAFQNTNDSKPSFRSISIQFVLMTVGFYYVLITTQSDNVRWRMPSARNARKLIRKIENRAVQYGNSETGFILRLRGERIDLIHRSLEHHAYCSVVRQVQVDWQPDATSFDASTITPRTDDYPTEFRTHPSGKVVRMSESTANKGPVDGIFLMKEGISLSCSDLERAFLEWKLEPTRAVGFFTERFENDLRQQHSSPLRDYNLVSDKALLVHRYYLNSRTVSMLLSHDGCQHLTLSAYVSAISSSNPKIIVPSNNKSSNSSYKIDANSFANDCLPVVLRAAGLSSNASAITKLIGQSSIIAR